MRVRFALSLVVLALAAVASACDSSGNGIGTAPPDNPCDPDAMPAFGTGCEAGQVCSFPDATCPGSTSPATTVYAFCGDPLTDDDAGKSGRVWQCVTAIDAGPVEAGTDGDAGEVLDGDAFESDGGDADGDDADAPSDADATTDGDATPETDGASEVDAAAPDGDGGLGVDTALDVLVDGVSLDVLPD
jgi:nicotinate-nucleotide--dimethylbenzimidazole phosphoribosyltransferase